MLARTIPARIGMVLPFTSGGLDLGKASRLACRAGGQHMALGRTFRVAPFFPMILAMAACVPQQSAPRAGNTVAPAVSSAPKLMVAPGSTTTDMTAPQPRTATYNCADGGRITIQNLGSSLHVLAADGTAEDLPASPANQNSRYGIAHDAIVIDGREALVMKGGKTPLTCTR